MAGGKIDAYLDCVSFYSYFAWLWLCRNKEALAENGVDIEFHPVFLGGINQGSGNKPPWMLPAKGLYSKSDTPRAQAYFEIPKALSPPSFFPPVSLLPQRAMLYLKSLVPSRYDQERFERTIGSLWICIFNDHWDISKPEFLEKALTDTREGYGAFSSEEACEFIEAASDPKWKAALNENTKIALEKGAFGAPWFWVTNARGDEGAFFGSDRLHFILQFLGIPFYDLEIVTKANRDARSRHRIGPAGLGSSKL